MSDKFKYNYSAPTPSQRREIEQIRNKYLVEKKEITKLSELKKIDNKVQSIKTIIYLGKSKEPTCGSQSFDSNLNAIVMVPMNSTIQKFCNLENILFQNSCGRNCSYAVLEILLLQKP